MISDTGRLAIIAAVLGLLLLGGLSMNNSPTPTAPIPTAPQISLEMLGPVYSEKAVYIDDLIHISFKTPLVGNKIQSDLPFWLHNVSGEVITVLWDHCSLQLPSGNTVNIVNKGPDGTIKTVLPNTSIALAPGGDLFDTIVPISEIVQSDAGLALTTGLFDQGPFQLVLALQVGADCSPEQIKYYTFQFIIR